MKIYFLILTLFGSMLLSGCVTSPLKSISVRLKPEQDLKSELMRVAKENHLKAAAIVSAVGSLKKLSLRLANAPQPTVFEGYHEIVSLSGTLSEDSMHVHLAASDSTGKTVGGHLVEGNPIYTTCELVLIEQSQYEFLRAEDPTYGYKELVIRSR
jgi:predicted DNA-binding protein with PD1-like motif